MADLYNTVYNIVDFGAQPGGKILCTNSFKETMEKCRDNKGGTVYVPAGDFLTGPIQMYSNTTLYLDSGSRLIFTDAIEEFPTVISRWEGEDSKVYSPLIFGDGVENVTVTGRGKLLGKGKLWWYRHYAKTLAYPRPKFICFQNSSNILIEKVNIYNSPAWTINPIGCNNVTIDKVSILNPPDSPNTDGINPESCSNVHISNCHIDVGDDCLTLKSGTEDCSVRIPCQNITVTNCTMVHGHGGVVIGSEMSGGVKNVVISNCIFQGTDRGIRIKSRRGRGGVVENIRVNNIIMENVLCPLVMHLFYFCGKNGKTEYVSSKAYHPVTDETPSIKGVHISNVIVREANAAAGFIYGLPEMPVEEISFNNISITMAKNPKSGVPAMMSGIEEMSGKGFHIYNGKDISFSNVKIKGVDGAAILIKDSEVIEIRDFKFSCTGKEPVNIINSRDIKYD